TPAAMDEPTIQKLSAKQQSVLRHAIAAADPLTANQLASLAGCTEGPIKTLHKNGFLHREKRRVMEAHPMHRPSMFAKGTKILGVENPGFQAPELTESQRQVLERINAATESTRAHTLLLHGVTGSGKTEVYIRAIQNVIQFGKQAIVLVPEISLTPQTRRRFEERFDTVAVLHSQMTPGERHYQWQRIRRGEVQVVIGARSAVFAPVPRLGLIILDEEHDASFKQDTQPRYHARRVAHRRAALQQVPLILGSATPSLETWHAAKTGRAELISMPQRVLNRPLPNVQLVDMRIKDERASRGVISRPLHNAIVETLRDQGQVLLLLNRRGFATNIQCPACGHVVACPDCDLPLTHHRDGSKAVCHFCDYQIPTPPWCPVCRYDNVRYSGTGTQRLEQEVKARFPEGRVARMDSDTVRRPGSHERILAGFRGGDLNILLGTQMIAKGLDFPNVLLVGVINADSALHFPDFRAAERTFQLVTQVAGRTGRGGRGGRVVVQTYTPEHPAIVAASKHDY
ncbi:MAG: primosomal protein N', partial [Planctomycetota bacterium]